MATRTSKTMSVARGGATRRSAGRSTQRNSLQSIATTIIGGPESTIPLSSRDIMSATVPMSATRRTSPYRGSAFAPTIRSSAITEVEQFETRPQTIVHNAWPEEMVRGISTRKGRLSGWQWAAAGAVIVVGGYLFAKVTGT